MYIVSGLYILRAGGDETPEGEQSILGGETVVTERRVMNAGDGYSCDFPDYGASHSR